MISKEEYIAWRNSDITQELYKEIAEKTTDVLAELVNRETSNPERDWLLRGFAKAMAEVVEWKPDFQEEEDQ